MGLLKFLSHLMGSVSTTATPSLSHQSQRDSVSSALVSSADSGPMSTSAGSVDHSGVEDGPPSMALASSL